MDFDSKDFSENHSYYGSNLGAVIRGSSVTFRLWAPTAEYVILNLFEKSDSKMPFSSLQMRKSVKGTWLKTVKCSHGTYYTYTIKGPEGIQEAVDPYAKAGSANGLRGMVVDLEKTNPKGFEKDSFVKCFKPENSVIWETHVRDFSNRIIGSNYRGKYLAFTEHGLKNSSGQKVGIDYLKDLGITHVQLQPVFDFGSGDETDTSNWFNWGYDPANYNFPEGSYSTNPNNGATRITEFKKMVQSLHKAGIGVVMDVVYNHTFFSTSNLWKTVPYYYYRYKGWQQLSNGSGCGNETASERPMFRKYMIDSVLFWQKEYHIDGFRFDLMALHDVETMKFIEKAVHKVNPNALIYGEPWAGGDSALPYSLRAVRDNLGINTRIAVFNDTIRDGLKGSTFDKYNRGYINGNVNGDTMGRVSYGIGAPNYVNYMSCHDNFTLWDKLFLSAPEADENKRLEMNRLGISILMISKSIPFFLSGEEFLRTKKGDGNSYMSSDEINNLDWESLKPGSIQLEMKNFYKKLIKMRKENAFLTEADYNFFMLENGVIRVLYSQRNKVIACAIINPLDNPINCPTVPKGKWKIIFNGTEFSVTSQLNAKTQIGAKSVLLAKLIKQKV